MRGAFASPRITRKFGSGRTTAPPRAAAKAKGKTNAKTKAKGKAGVLRCAQNDKARCGGGAIAPCLGVPGRNNGRLELEAVVEFGVDLAGVVVVEAAEGDAVVEQDAVVAYVDRSDGGGEFFGEGFADGEIDGGVLRQVGVGVARVCLILGRDAGGVAAVDEAGAVVDVGGGEGAPGERGGEAL